MSANQEKPPNIGKQPPRARLRRVSKGWSAEQCLAEMRPAAPKLRFLISWDHALYDMLEQWGFSQRSTRSARFKGQPRRAWVLPDARLKEIEAEHAPLLASRSGGSMAT